MRMPKRILLLCAAIVAVFVVYVVGITTNSVPAAFISGGCTLASLLGGFALGWAERGLPY